MSKHSFAWSVFGLFVWVSASPAYAMIVYSNLSQGGGSIGYINGSESNNDGNMIGKGISLDMDGAIITSATFLVDTAPSFSSGPGTFQLAFYEINPGVDGQYQTSDDLLGSQIGSTFTATNMVIASGETFTLSGFSYNVPQHFAWVLTVASSNLSFLFESNDEENATGGSSNPNYLWWNLSTVSGTGPLETGSQVGFWFDYANPSVQFEGGVIPEPATIALLLMGGAAMLTRDRKRSS